MTRRAAALAALAAVVALGVVPADVSAQEAATVTETGWWSRNPGAVAPSGGFQVAAAPDGPVSVAAVRIDVAAASLTQALLVLSESTLGGVAAYLQVCPTAAAWTAASPGPMTSAPAADCGAGIALQRNEAQKVWTADILNLLGSGTGQKSVVIVPAAQPTPIPLPFQVDFAGATLQSAGEFAPASDTSSGSIGGGIVDPGPAFGSETEVPTDLGVAPSFSAPTDVPAAVPPISEQVAAAPAQVPGRFPQRGDIGIPASSGSKKPWGRLPLLVIAAAAVGAGAALARQRLQAMGWLPSG